MLASPAFYLTVSFIAFLGLLYRYAWRPLIRVLEAHIADVKNTLQQADAEKKKALHALEEEQKCYERLDEHIQTILDDAHRQCDLLRHNIKIEIEAESLEQLERLKVKTEKMKQDFLYQLRDHLSDQIIEKIYQWTQTHLQPELQASSQKKAIELLQQVKPFDD